MKRRELTLAMGGLYACCLASFYEWVAEAPDADVQTGDKLACRHCNTDGGPTEMVVLRGGETRWLDPDYPPLPLVSIDGSDDG